MFIINILYSALLVLIFARVILSWITLDPYHPLYQLIHRLTEPILAPVRNLLPPMGGFDLSPIIVIFGAQILVGILRSFF